MAKVLQLRRDVTANVALLTGAIGELIIDTTKHIITVHDGSTVGGWPTPSFVFANGAYNTANSATTNINTANTFLQSNDYTTLTVANANTGAGIASANTWLRANDYITLTAANANTGAGIAAANTWLQANTGAGIAAANTWLQANTSTKVNRSGDTMTGALTATAFTGALSGAVGALTANTGAFTSLSATGGLSFSTTNSISAAGTTQATATVLVGDTKIVTTTAPGTGVILPTGVGRDITVINRGANPLLVYPATGYSIVGAATNAATTVPTSGWLSVACVSATNYYAVAPVTIGGINTSITQSNNGTLTISANTSGVGYYYCPTPTALTVSTTLSIAQMLTTIVTVTSAIAVTLTLPTGALTQAGVSSLMGANMSFDWYVINLGSSIGAITMAGAATGHTFVGNATEAITTTAQFRTQMVSSGVFVTYRLG